MCEKTTVSFDETLSFNKSLNKPLLLETVPTVLFLIPILTYTRGSLFSKFQTFPVISFLESE
jgi:hypothetical protein